MKQFFFRCFIFFFFFFVEGSKMEVNLDKILINAKEIIN